MSRRINIILPYKTVAVLDRAVRQLVETESRAKLRTLLKQEAIGNAERDLAIATEWDPLEEEVVQLTKTVAHGNQPANAHELPPTW
jgi:hypothetical protein